MIRIIQNTFLNLITVYYTFFKYLIYKTLLKAENFLQSKILATHLANKSF